MPTAPAASTPQPRCCGEDMEHLGSGVWQCDPCGCLLTAKASTITDRRRCPDHPEPRPIREESR